jgi:hypothetical protein
MNRFRSLVKVGVVAGLVAVLLGGLGAGTAAAQSVKGTGIIKYSNGAKDGGNDFIKVTVNAWLDEGGFAQGTMTWQGSLFQSLPHGNTGTPGGPSDPYQIKVTALRVRGNMAWVSGVVVSSPKGLGNGSSVSFTFTDNDGTGKPDELDGAPIDSGRYTVED